MVSAVNPNNYLTSLFSYKKKEEEEVTFQNKNKISGKIKADLSSRISKIEKDDYYSWTLAKRVSFAVGPVFRAYPPLSKPITAFLNVQTIVISLSKLLNIDIENKWGISKNVIITAIAISALIGTILYHPLGICIDAGFDAMINSIEFVRCLSAQEYKKALECCFFIICDALYLSTFYFFSPEMEAIALAAEFLLLVYEGIKDGMNKQYIESTGDVLLAVVRILQICLCVPDIRKKYLLAS